MSFFLHNESAIFSISTVGSLFAWKHITILRVYSTFYYFYLSKSSFVTY